MEKYHLYRLQAGPSRQPSITIARMTGGHGMIAGYLLALLAAGGIGVAPDADSLCAGQNARILPP